MSKTRVLLMAMALTAIGGCGSGGSSSSISTSPAAVPSTTSGTIAGFGSIIINGTHYNTSTTSFVVDDLPGTQADLSAGQVVTISGTTDSQGNHAANSVEYDSLVVGPISSIDPAGNSFTALGQTVNVDVTTVYANVANFAALAVGNNIVVSGARDASGNIAATFVAQLASAPSKVRLSGPVANLDLSTSSFTVGGETISFPSATIVPSGAVLADGAPVVVVGTTDSTGTTINATKVRLHKPLDGSKSGEQGELEGLITQAAQNNTFNIGTAVVNYDANTTFKGGSATDLMTGARVEVHGSLNADGSLQAARIDIEQTEHSINSVGFVIGNLSAVPDTTSTPNTISLLGVTIAISDHTILRDDAHHNQSFKLSDLAAGDRVAVAFTLTPATGGGAPTLTALKLQHANASETASGASGPFSNVDGSALALTVDNVSVTGQADCSTPAGPSGTGTSTCTTYLLHGRLSTGSAFFAALADPANASAVVFAHGNYAGGTLTTDFLALQTENGSGGGQHPH